MSAERLAGASAAPAPAKGMEGRRCAQCGAAANGGRFCSECGAPFEGALCAACRSALTAGARFCHRCGTAVGSRSSASRPAQAAWPWAFVGTAFLALVILVVGRNFTAGMSRSSPSAEAVPAGSAARAPSDVGASDDGNGSGEVAGAGPRAPDISALSPRERADRLFDRVMRLSEQGKRDSVEFFAPMVMAAYQMLGPLDLDQHYDLGRIGVVTGVPGLAWAEADTILRANPTHLLGLTLAAEAATAANRVPEARSYYRRLVAAAPAEIRKSLSEYGRHRHDIDAGLAEAKKLGIQRGT